MSKRSPELSQTEGEREPKTDPIPRARFEMGEIVITPDADFSLAVRGRHPVQLLARHVEGNWGNIHEHDKEENEQSADQGGRIFSAYDIEDGRFYVVTECDRSVTTILLPHEY